MSLPAGRIYRIAICCALFVYGSTVMGYGQTQEGDSVTGPNTTTTSTAPDTGAQSAEEIEAVETTDTGESILFLGRKLAYEAKKRLNLTTEEEEKTEEKKKEYTLRFFGIVIERK